MWVGRDHCLHFLRRRFYRMSMCVHVVVRNEFRQTSALCVVKTAVTPYYYNNNVLTECFKYHYRRTGDGSRLQKQQIEFTSPAWLHSSGWDRSLHTVLIVHGYGGTTEDYLPSSVLRDGKRIIDYSGNVHFKWIQISFFATIRSPKTITTVAL